MKTKACEEPQAKIYIPKDAPKMRTSIKKNFNENRRKSMRVGENFKEEIID